MEYFLIFSLILLLSVGFSLLSVASDQDDVDNHNNFR
jgi:hypothetical protein